MHYSYAYILCIFNECLLHVVCGRCRVRRSMPVVEQFRSAQKLVDLDAEASVEDVWALVCGGGGSERRSRSV